MDFFSTGYICFYYFWSLFLSLEHWKDVCLRRWGSWFSWYPFYIVAECMKVCSNVFDSILQQSISILYSRWGLVVVGLWVGEWMKADKMLSEKEGKTLSSTAHKALSLMCKTYIFLQAHMYSIYNFQQNSPPWNTSYKFPLWNGFYVLFCFVFLRFTFVLSYQNIPSTLHTELRRHLLLHKLRFLFYFFKLHSPLKWSQKIVRIFHWKSLFFNFLSFLSLCSVLTHWIRQYFLLLSCYIRTWWFRCDVPCYIRSVE